MKRFAKLFFVAIILAAVVPHLVFACTIPSVWNINTLKGPLVTCTGNTQAPAGSPLPPCTSLCDFVCTVIHVIYFTIAFAIWIILPLCFAIGGIMFIISRGNPEGISKAKHMLTGSLIATCIILSAWLIVATFISVFGLTNTFGYFGGGAACSVQAAPSTQQSACSSGLVCNGQCCGAYASACDAQTGGCPN